MRTTGRERGHAPLADASARVRVAAVVETAERLSSRAHAGVRSRRPRRAAAGSHIVPRKALVARLCRSDAEVVTVTGPAGDGKTTLLGQWAENDSRTLVSILYAADRPAPFVAAAAGARERLRKGASLLGLRDGADVPWPPAVVAEIGARVAARAAGSTIVTAAPTDPPLPTGALRAEAQLVEIG